MVDSSGLKVLVVTITMWSGGHDQSVEGRYFSAHCTKEAMALAIQFKTHPPAGIKKVEIDCVREAEYERRKNENGEWSRR